MGRRQALIGALRREDAAVKEVKRLEAELEGMRGLLKVCCVRWKLGAFVRCVRLLLGPRMAHTQLPCKAGG